MVTSLSCPKCGSEIIIRSQRVSLVSCDHCSSALLLEPSGLKESDIDSHIYNKLSIIKQGEKFVWRNQIFRPQGFIQLKHKEGFRKEWWVLDEVNNSFWLCEEDETFFLLQDVALEINTREKIPPWLTLQINTQLSLLNKTWLVTEKGEHSFYGFKGQLPYLTKQTEMNQYTYLTAEDAEILVLVFEGNQVSCRQGYWLDPFELQASL